MKSLKVTCVNCNKTFTIKVEESDLEDYLKGKKLIQQAFPYLKAWERELMMSQLCDDCFNELCDEMAEEYFEFKYEKS